MTAPIDATLEDLASALEMVAWSWAELRAFLPRDGYTDEGVVSECVEGLRDAMGGVPDLLRRGLLAPGAAADAFECHLAAQQLMSDLETRSPKVFASHPGWRRVRALAAAARGALPR